LKFINRQTNLAIQIESSLLERMYEHGLAYYPDEIGGLLVGYYSEDSRTAVIIDIILPDKFVSTHYSFDRGSEGLEPILREYYKRTPPLFYLGEWHTHPDGPVWPSRTDVKAMDSVSLHELVYIDNPILLIIVVNREACQPGFFIRYNEKLIFLEKDTLYIDRSHL